MWGSLVSRLSRPWYRADKDTWYCRVEGRRVSLAVRGPDNAKAAEDAWHKLMAGDRPGRPTRPIPLGRPSPKSLPPSWPTPRRGWSPNAQVLAPLLAPFSHNYGHLAADALTCRQAEPWARRPTWRNSTRNDALGTLAACFRWAAEKVRLLDVSPLKGITMPPKESQGAGAVTPPDDFDKLMKSTAGDFRALLQFLWLTGCRPSEATALTVADLVDAAGVIVLRKHKTAHKGKVRMLYLSDGAQVLLRAQAERHGDGLLFRNDPGGPWRRNAIVNRMWRLNAKLGIRTTAYGFRHSFATDALANGVPQGHVAALLGHCGTAMLHKHYSHVSSQAQVLREALKGVRPGPSSAAWQFRHARWARSPVRRSRPWDQVIPTGGRPAPSIVLLDGDTLGNTATT